MNSGKLLLGKCLGLSLSLTAAFLGLGKVERFLQPTWTVCLSGCPYTSVQAAIDNSPEGATITVGPGNYRASLSAIPILGLWALTIMKGKS